MGWLWGSDDNAVEQTQMDSQTLQSDAHDFNTHGQMVQTAPQSPLFALDQLKASGIPLRAQMTPYLQMDPSVFTNTTPQIIMPEGSEGGRARFEMALGFIGAGVGSAFATGCLRGGIPQIISEKHQLVSPAFGTRLLNASGKYGSGYAQTVGSIAVIYSLCEVLARYCRKADDAFNSVGAGIFTGAFYRCPYGLRASLIGAAVGFVGGVVAEYSRNEYERLDEIIAKFRYKL